ncbi:MAG: NADH-quinone oxidoreductase subunit J [Acidobacteriota bacterium]|nr:NADH-quinone oxidoreductase subunit J [Acidobacteriota bacterium]
MEVAVFAVFALLALGSALVVVLHRNPIYSTMSLVVTLISIAVLFVLLGAPFLAALQVLVYTGAILVLFLFVLMLLNVGAGGRGPDRLGQKIGAVGASAAFGVVMLTLLWGRFHGFELSPLTEEIVALKPLAKQLMTTYLLPFEMVGLLLLAAVIAATALAKKPEVRLPREKT